MPNEVCPEAIQFSFSWWQVVLAPLAILISGGFGAFIAWKSIISAREVARKREVMDFINDTQKDDYFVEGMAIIVDIHHHGEKHIENYANPNFYRDDLEKDKEARLIRYALNMIEHLSVGIGEGIFHEPLAYRIRRGAIIRTWHQTKRFVEQRREYSGNYNLYKELQSLAEAWEDEKYMKNHHNSSLFSN